MSLFGKFMAVLNFFGVVAVLIMALLVYAQRRAWQYTVYRHDLMIYGLPLDKEETDNQDYVRYLDLGSPGGTTQKALFPTNPVGTQVEEVDRVKKLLDASLAGLTSDTPAHLTMLANTLLPLSVTNTQREYYLTIMAQCHDKAAYDLLRQRLEDAYKRGGSNATKNKTTTFDKEFSLALRFPEPVVQAVPPPQGLQVLIDAEPREPFEEAFIRVIQPNASVAPNLAMPFAEAFDAAVATVRTDLQNHYTAAFEVALKGVHTGAAGDAKPVGADQRRHTIARLLMCLDASLPKDPRDPKFEPAIDTDLFASQSFKRIVNVIGVQEADAELSAEALIYARISSELDKQIERDRTTFLLEHQALMSEAHALAQKTVQQEDEVKQLKEKVATQTALVALRTKNVADARNELAARRAYTAQLLEIIHQMEDAVHTTRVEVRDANTVNQGYVEKIKQLEDKR